jgi:hypothetical protein
MGQVFQKKQWRRRIVIRLCIIPAALVLVFAGTVFWVMKALPGITAREISRLTNTQIEMGPLTFHRDASVSIDGLVVRPPRSQFFYDATILRVKTVHAKFSWASLLLLSPRVRELHMEDFILDLQYDLDSGLWNVHDLQFTAAPKTGSKGIPMCYLRSGKLRYSKVSGGESSVVMSLPVEAQFGPGDLGSDSYSFDVKTSTLSGGYGDSALHGTWRPGRIELAGGLSSTDIPSLERAWAVDVLAADATYDDSGKYMLKVTLKDVHSKRSAEVDSLRMVAPPILGPSNPLSMAQQFFARYQPSGTVSQINLTATGRLDAIDSSDISGLIDCKDISVCDRQFPYPIDHLSGAIVFTQSLIKMNRLSAKHGQTDLIIDGWTNGVAGDQQYVYQVTSDNMALDEQLYVALQPRQKAMWDAFAPKGTIGVDYRLSRTSGSEETCLLNVDLRGVSAKYDRFPYPLSGLTGALNFNRDNITVSNVVASDAGSRIALNGRVLGAESANPVYDIRVEANDVPLNKAVGDALPAMQRDLYRHFDAVGTADARCRVYTTAEANTPGPAGFFADVTLKKAALRVEGLPDAVSNIDAKATITVDSLSVAGAAGQYGQSPVSLSGGMRFAPDGRPLQYSLKIAAQQVPWDEKVLQALPEPVKSSVAALHAEGKADFSLEFAKADSNMAPDYRMTVKCLGDTIRHDWFPYSLADVQGTVTIDRNAVTFADVRARPALQPQPDLNPSIRIEGRLPLSASERRPGALAVQAKDILFTAALGEALPKAWAGVYRDLAPRGPFDLDWRASTITRDANDRSKVVFDGRVDFRTCSLNLSGAGAELAGALGLTGTYDSVKGLTASRLHLAADRLMVKNKDFTQVKADVIYDPNTGVWTADNFLGRCYDGRVIGNLDVAQARPGVMQYLLTVSLSRVNLEPFLVGHKVPQAPGAANPPESSGLGGGVMNAALSLGAQIGDGSGRLGACKIHVVDMQVGKMSPLSKLLAVLSLTEPADYAFERLLVESYLKRNKLLIHKFDMEGKNVAFAGNGSMDLLTDNVNLTLTARGKRLAESQPSVIQSLTEGLTGGVMRMEVTGKADNPQVETKTLPVIGDSLKILGSPRDNR